MESGKVLVTGTGGQVGRALMAAQWPDGFSPVGFSHGELDIGDAAALRRALAEAGAVAVINAAAYTQVDKAEQEPEQAWRINADAVANLARLTAEMGIPLLHISTDYVFNGSKNEPYTEDDPIGPASAYGASKAAGEQAARHLNPRHLILRTSWVYDHAGKNFLNTMLRLAADRDELGVVADQHGAPTAAADIAGALLRMLDVLKHGAQPWGTYHFTGGGATTWHGFAEAIFDGAAPVTGRRPRVKPIATADWPSPARRPANSRLDCSKIRQIFGVQPRPWEAMLADVLKARLAG